MTGQLRLLVVALLGAAPLVPASAHAAFPGQNGKIAYVGSASGNSEIYSVNPDGSGATNITNHPADDSFPAWSPDGMRIAFVSNRDDPNPKTCSPWCNTRIYVMNADGSSQHQVTINSNADREPTWAPDGTRIAFKRGQLYTMDAGGTNATPLTTNDPFFEGIDAPAWSPDGSLIAFGGDVGGDPHAYWYHWLIRPDGSGLRYFDADSFNADWSPDGQRLVLDKGPGIFTLATTGGGYFEYDGNGYQPAWSPDGTKIAFIEEDPNCCDYQLKVMNVDGSGVTELVPDPVRWPEGGPDWQPIPINAYPRPKGATPVHASLVPAYAPCASPNRQHGPPLAFASCNPPAQTSDELTVGTADSNGKPTRSVSAIKLKTIPGTPPNPPDEADVKLEASITDVYNQVAFTDYAGELRAQTSLRITDKLNTPHPGGPGAGTVTDFSFGFTIPCVPTPDPNEGGACTLNTTADALFPGAIAEGRRAIWQLGAVEVYDGGADDDGDTGADNTLFMKQGIFVP